MIDRFIFLTPLVLLPILFLFAFVGCKFETGGVPGPQATLIFHPDVLAQRNIQSFTVNFGLSAPNTFLTDSTSKLVNEWDKTAKQDQVSVPWGQVPDSNGPFTATCTVTLVDNNSFQSVVPQVTQSNISQGSLSVSFELQPTDDNPQGTFTLVNA